MMFKGHAIVCIIAALSHLVSAKTETYSRRGYQLTFNDSTDSFSAATQKRMVDTFFTVYPKIVRTYNRAAPKKVTFMVNPKMPQCIAASGFGRLVSLNPKYFANHPNDIDVITHEVSSWKEARVSILGWVLFYKYQNMDLHPGVQYRTRTCLALFDTLSPNTRLPLHRYFKT